jgi:hypothetical protein
VAAQNPLGIHGSMWVATQLNSGVDMTSDVNRIEMVTRGIYISALFSLSSASAHTRVDAEMGPVLPTVDPADIRGLGTTVL